MRASWKEIWHKRPFQMTPEELAEYEKVKDTARWREFDAAQQKKLQAVSRKQAAHAKRELRKIKPMSVEEAQAFWDSLPTTADLPRKPLKNLK